MTLIFGTGPNGPWIQTPLGKVDVTDAELRAACEQHGIKLVTTTRQPTPIEQALGEIHNQYAHGHGDDLVEGCTLCAAEIAAVMAWCRTNKPLEQP